MTTIASITEERLLVKSLNCIVALTAFPPLIRYCIQTINLVHSLKELPMGGGGGGVAFLLPVSLEKVKCSQKVRSEVIQVFFVLKKVLLSRSTFQALIKKATNGISIGFFVKGHISIIRKGFSNICCS